MKLAGTSLIPRTTSESFPAFLQVFDCEADDGCSQDETSEEFLGEWMEKRGIRDQIVVATKARHTLC